MNQRTGAKYFPVQRASSARLKLTLDATHYCGTSICAALTKT
jgi:hypothetical protein